MGSCVCGIIAPWRYGVSMLWTDMFSWLLGGIGLFFVGVRFIGNHLRQLSGPGFRRLVARSVAPVPRGALLGLVAGVLTQSARAVTFILVSMTAAGMISVRQALPVLAWANVGTSALVLVATIDLRAAVLYLLAFNPVAVGLLLPLYHVEVAWGVPLLMAATMALTPEPAMQAALIFLAVQLSGAIALTALRRPLPALMARRAPVMLEEQLAQPAFLYDRALDDAPSAIGLVEREQGRLLGHLEGYLSKVESEFTGRIAPVALAAADGSVSERVGLFLSTLLDGERDRRTLDLLLNLRARQRVLDDLREALLPFDALLLEARARMALSHRNGLSERLQEAAHFMLGLLHEAAEDRDGDGAALASLRDLSSDRSATLEGLRRRWLQQVSDGEAAGLEPLFGATTLFERISWLVSRYAQLLAATGRVPSKEQRRD